MSTELDSFRSNLVKKEVRAQATGLSTMLSTELDRIRTFPSRHTSVASVASVASVDSVPVSTPMGALKTPPELLSPSIVPIGIAMPPAVRGKNDTILIPKQILKQTNQIMNSGSKDADISDIENVFQAESIQNSDIKRINDAFELYYRNADSIDTSRQRINKLQKFRSKYMEDMKVEIYSKRLSLSSVPVLNVFSHINDVPFDYFSLRLFDKEQLNRVIQSDYTYEIFDYYGVLDEIHTQFWSNYKDKFDKLFEFYMYYDNEKKWNKDSGNILLFKSAIPSHLKNIKLTDEDIKNIIAHCEKKNNHLLSNVPFYSVMNYFRKLYTTGKQILVKYGIIIIRFEIII